MPSAGVILMINQMVSALKDIYYNLLDEENVPLFIHLFSHSLMFFQQLNIAANNVAGPD